MATPAPAAHTPAALQACIDLCLDCYRSCLAEATGHCLEKGGRHADADHISLMLGCAQLCRTTAEFMLMQTKLHYKVCGACAEICEACAVSCEQLEDMEHCVEICRRCADECRRIALGMTKAS
ncbi:MAG TPA: four-helix bundle copper-binding protein [Burkholderiales bacterium]|nr:four-helix bundle copper-binding protein [Burkholderiales bacterium]